VQGLLRCRTAAIDHQAIGPGTESSRPSSSPPGAIRYESQAGLFSGLRDAEGQHHSARSFSVPVMDEDKLMQPASTNLGQGEPSNGGAMLLMDPSQQFGDLGRLTRADVVASWWGKIVRFHTDSRSGRYSADAAVGLGWHRLWRKPLERRRGTNSPARPKIAATAADQRSCPWSWKPIAGGR